MTKDPATIVKAIGTVVELIELTEKKLETLKELRKALRIMMLAPSVVHMGKVSTRVEGGLRYSTFHGDHPTRETDFVISSERDEVRVPLFWVPIDMWPARYSDSLRKANRKLYDNLLETVK